MPADQTQPPPVNRNHKDTIFRDLFGTEQNKANALSLFNALSGTNYEDPNILVFTTLDNVLYMGVKNDISFRTNFKMILWEHQSTHNPNMPLRGLSYFARLYAAWIEGQKYSVYASTILKIPTPEYFVFYIGEEKRPDKEILRLSDAFRTNKGDVEVTATVLNINKGHNARLMAACKTLSDYASFIALIREYNESMELPEAVDAAVDYCIDHGILSDYLRGKKEKVRDMFLTEYDQEKTMRQLRDTYIKEGLERGIEQGIEQGLEQGLEQGIEQGRQSVLRRIVQKIVAGAMSVQDACDLGYTEDETSCMISELVEGTLAN